jgi:hypothetical protein
VLCTEPGVLRVIGWRGLYSVGLCCLLAGCFDCVDVFLLGEFFVSLAFLSAVIMLNGHKLLAGLFQPLMLRRQPSLSWESLLTVEAMYRRLDDVY